MAIDSAVKETKHWVQCFKAAAPGQTAAGSGQTAAGSGQTTASLTWGVWGREDPLASTTTGAAVLFWYDAKHLGRLPAQAHRGLASAAKNGSFAGVFLFSYNDLQDLPAGVQAMDPEPYVPLSRFEALLSAGKQLEGIIALLSHYVRLKIASYSAYPVTWIVDCDTIWFRAAIPEKVAYGHAWATFELNTKSQENKNILERLATLTVEYCISPRDFLQCGTPSRFPRDSPMLKDLVRTIEADMFPESNLPQSVTGGPLTNYDEVMVLTKKKILREKSQI